MDTERLVRHTLRWGAQGFVAGATVLAPWLIGSSDGWAYLIICLLVNVGVGLWLVSLVLDPRARVRAPILTLGLGALLLLLCVQMMPVSPGLARLCSPLAARTQAAASGALEQAEAAAFLPAGLPAGPPSTLSASPGATRRAFYLLLAYVGAFLVMANTFTRWRNLRTVASVVAGFGFLLAVVAILQRITGSKQILWFYQPRWGGWVFGSFTNHNHYALHMSMIFGLTLGLLLAATRDPVLQTSRSLRSKLGWLSTSRASRVVLLSFVCAVMGASVFMSLSRGGIASLAAALAAVGIGALTTQAGRRWAPAIGVVAVLLVAGVVWLGWRPVTERLGTLAQAALEPSSLSRPVATRDTLAMFTQSPALGSGFGAFQYVFPQFQSPEIQFGAWPQRWLHAHNDYAQLLAEGGVLGGLLLASCVVLFLVAVRKRFLRGELDVNGAWESSGQGRMMVGGLGVGLLAAMLHSFVDYGLHKPANGLLLAVLCGFWLASVSVSTQRTRRQSSEDSPDASSGTGSRSARGQRARRVLRAARPLVVRGAALVSLVVLLVIAMAETAEWRGELAFERFFALRVAADGPRVGPRVLAELSRRASGEAELAMLFDRSNPEVLWWVSSGTRALATDARLEGALKLRLADKAARAAALAVRAAPSDYLLWYWFGQTLADLHLPAQADVCLQRAQELAPPGLNLRLALPAALRERAPGPDADGGPLAEPGQAPQLPETEPEPAGQPPEAAGAAAPAAVLGVENPSQAR